MWRRSHSACTLFLYSSPKHLPLSAVRQDIGLDGAFIYPGMAVFCVWGLEWAVAVKPHHPGSDYPKCDFPLLPKLCGCSASSAFPKSCSQQKCSIGGWKEQAPSSRAVYFYVFILAQMEIFFSFSPLNREFRKVTSFLIPDTLWALKKILDNTEQLRCHFNSSFK